jgi:hypothetical protein
MRTALNNIGSVIIQGNSKTIATNVGNVVDAVDATEILEAAINRQLSALGVSVNIVFVNEYDREYNPSKRIGYWFVRTDKGGEAYELDKAAVKK